MLWIPFAGAISEAAGTILEKTVLRKRKINTQQQERKVIRN